MFGCFFNAENERLKVLNILPGNLGIPLLMYFPSFPQGYDFTTDQNSLYVVLKQLRNISLKAN